jgi:protease-4
MGAMLPSRPAILLEVDLTAPTPGPGLEPVSRWAYRSQPPLRAMVESLRRAARDDRVVGLVAQVGETPLGLAEMQELRAAIRGFAASGKPTVAWAESFGELTPAVPGYALATAFDTVWLQPSGVVGLHGLAVAVPFLRTALDKLGIEPRLGQRYEYKNAADSLQRTGFSDAHREAVTSLLESLAEQLIAAIADGRGLTAATVRELMDASPIAAQQAREAGLVDRVGYRDEAYSALQDQLAGADPQRLLLGRYRPHPIERANRAAAGALRQDKRDVGLLQLSGTVRQGHAPALPFAAEIASSTVVAALARLAEDDRIGALVIRVDSPGGSYVASDAIWRAVGQVQASGRPVVACLGNTAASGGYFISMGADRIVAAPASVTGSIGVFGGKVLINGLLAKLGIDVGDVGVGSRAFLASPVHDYDEDEQQALAQWLDAVYWDFVTKAAAGRGMTSDAVHEVAKGRVWTGRQALQHGLVDELGGVSAALNLARRSAGLPTTARVREIPLISAWQALRGPRTADDAAAGLGTGAWGPFTEVAARLGLPAAGPLVLPWHASGIR